MASRRALTLALPASDPRSAQIWAFLDALDADADVSAELRARICESLDQADRLARIEATLEAVRESLRAGGGVAPPPAPARDPAVDPAILARMLDFDT